MKRAYKLTSPRRLARTELEHHLVDEFVSGRLSRREFLRHSSVIGMSLPLLGSLIGTGIAPTTRAATTAEDFTIRAATITPTGAIDPVTISDVGSVTVLGQTAEYLLVSAGDLRLRPAQARRTDLPCV